ncbi:MAG: type II and III secretion system protein family protein [Vicinamibacterales bacterium]
MTGLTFMTRYAQPLRTLLLLCAVLAIGDAPPLHAQATPAPAASMPRVSLTAGRSTVLAVEFDITRIAVTNPAIADAVVVAPREILIDGKAQGTISLIIWGDGRRTQYDIAVDAPVSQLQQQLRNLFPGEDIQVTVNEEAITLSGRVSANAVMLKAGEIAEKTSSKHKIINLLQVPGGIDTQQVMLQVRFAEVNRQALTEAGVSLFTGVDGYKDWIGRSTTQQFSAPIFDVDRLTFSDFLNLFVFNTKYNVGGLLKALQSRGFLQSLAEPNLIAYNGKEASFLAGGEVPVPVVQSSQSGGAVTIYYKEFGIRLSFTPTIAGDVIRLHVKPEVSSLDFASGVSINGFRVPALITRRAETEIELRDGQSFAIAGLMNNIAQTDRAAVPLLGSLPIIGNLFKSKAARQQRTELMVLITPRLVKPLDPDEVPELPTESGQFLKDSDALGAQLQGGAGTVDAPNALPAERR